MLIKNGRIITFNNNKIIENGYIEIENGLIEKIGEMSEVKEINNKNIIDAKGKLVLPGFICTHTHIYSAFARGMGLKGGSTNNFLEILQNLWWRLDKKLTYEDIYYSALVTIVELIKNGVTCAFDHHASPNSVDGSLDVLEKAFRELGCRSVLCYEVSDRDGEDIALKGIKENSRFISKTKNASDDMVKGIFGLHAAFTLSDKTLEKSSIEGNNLGSGFHIHVAEGKKDKDYNKIQYNKGVVERLNDFSIINNKSILAHCIHIKEEEKELLKRGNVIHNPESNMNNAVGYCDALDLMNKGVIVGLGSDGFSANPFRAMDVCYVLHKHQKENPTVMTPNDVIQMAIYNNSRIASKFFNNEVGIIKQGAKADIIMMNYNNPTPLKGENINGHIIFGMNSNMITDSIINGKVILKDRNLVNVDEKKIMEESRVISESLWKRF